MVSVCCRAEKEIHHHFRILFLAPFAADDVQQYISPRCGSSRLRYHADACIILMPLHLPFLATQLRYPPESSPASESACDTNDKNYGTMESVYGNWKRAGCEDSDSKEGEKGSGDGGTGNSSAERIAASAVLATMAAGFVLV